MFWKKGLGIGLMFTGLYLILTNAVLTGAVIGFEQENLLGLFGVLVFIVGIGLILSNAGLEYRLKAPRYRNQPEISERLKKRLISAGTYQDFLRDYSNLYHNFSPQKLVLPSRGETYTKKEDLPDGDQRSLDKLGKNYAETLHQLLELGTLLEKDEKEYAIIGGFGVLGNLVQHNPKFVSRFRGSEDIDILSKEGLGDVYGKLGYRKIPTERVDLSTIPDGRLDTYIRENPATDTPLKIQERRTIAFGRVDSTQKVFNTRKKVTLYGVSIWVADPDSLIKSKNTGRARKDKLGSLKDLHDKRQLELIDEYERGER